MAALLVTVLLTIYAPFISPAEVESAIGGQTIVRAESFTTDAGKSAGRGIGAIVIERSVADVWTTLSRYEDRMEYIPRIKSLTVLEKQPGRVRVKQEIDATVTTARYTAWYDLDEKAHTIHWTLDTAAPDNTLKAVDGDYALVEVAPLRTLLVYRSYVDSGLHVPQSIQNYMTRKSLPDLLRNIKRRVESGNTWKR